MDPVTAMMAAGTAIQIGSSIFGSQDTQKAYQAQQNIANLDIQVNQQRQQAMQLSASRQQLENVRNAQRARAMGLNAATNQGAQMGTGLQGGYGQTSGQYSTNQLGITQNLQIGENIFGLDNQIDQQKVLASQAQSSASTWQGIGGIGGSLTNSAATFGKLGQSFGNTPATSMSTYGGQMSMMGSNGIY